MGILLPSRSEGRLRALKPMGPVLRAIAWNLAVGSPMLGKRPPADGVRIARRGQGLLFKTEGDPEEWKANTRRLVGPALSRRLGPGRRKLHVPRPRPPVDQNLALASELLGLEALEREILLFSVATVCAPWLCDYYVEEERFQSGDVRHDIAAFVAAGLARGEPAVLEALRPDRALLRSGLLRLNDYSGASLRLQLDPRLLGALFSANLTREGLQGRFVSLEPAPTLTLADFAHLDGAAEFALRLVRSSMAAGRSGVNLLFYGPTGVGKTELARLLTREAGASLYAIGRAGDHELSPSPEQRLASALVGQRFVDPRRGALLFDEMEDVLGESDPIPDFESGDMELRSTAVSKLWFNELLERNRVVTIWITNDVEAIDAALLRRFSFVVEFPPATAALRRRVLERCLSPEARVGPEEREQLAARFAVSPAQLATATAAARLVAEDGRETTADLERVLAPAAKLATGRDAPPARALGAAGYLLEAINTPVDLATLTDRLARDEGTRGATLCLYGPPGTGKTEYVHYLARRMGRRLVERAVSDLLSCYVGETEQNIAEAFREAEQEGAVLLFDEADSLLMDRRGATRSWELTQTNEFLQRLERSRGVVACTTNLLQAIDQAALRRFVFKIPFLPLRPEQAVLLFQRVLGPWLATPFTAAMGVELERALSKLTTLTPGDFAAVARRQAALGLSHSLEELFAELRSELAVKQGTARAIGF